MQALATVQELKGRLVRPFLFVCLAVVCQGCAAMPDPNLNAGAADANLAPSGRLRPSPALACDRNHLTSYSGLVSGYRRDADSTWLEISTDEDTVESVTAPHDGQADASAHYQLWGARFAAGDFAQIEKSPGVLLQGMRAIAWVCDDGITAPLIDWQPKRD